MLKLIKMLLLMGVLLILPACRGETFQNGSAYCKNKACTFTADQVDMKRATAFGTYNDTLMENGWGILDIVAGNGNPRPADEDIMFAAGFLEGRFTASRIAAHYQNVRGMFFSSERGPIIEAKVKKYFIQQDQWMRKMIKENVPKNPLWRHVGYIISQYDGLIEGYNAARLTQKTLPALETYAFQVLNGAGDLIDLVKALDPQSIPDWRKMTKEQAMLYIQDNGHCSVLVKVLGAYEDLFMSHSSWFYYSATSRIYKHYNLNVSDKSTSARRISFASYPGFLESWDDFYLLGSKMVMLQTTNSILNSTLYKSCSPNSLLAWHRVRVANMLANSGKEWADILAEYNSGTYNNQYMVIDLKQITLGKEIRDNALWVVEQIPTLVVSSDETQILRAGYWPSYNVPFFEEIYNMSGYPEFSAQHGVDSTYQLAPRAKIFRRDEGKVVDLASFKNIMRYNDYKKDKYSEDNPCNTICCRGDLDAKSPRAYGCYDTKVMDFNMALNLEADIVNGPTLGDDLPPFKWTPTFNVSHTGLPNVYNFPFISTSPRYERMSGQQP